MSIFDRIYPPRLETNKLDSALITEKGLSGWNIFTSGKKTADLFDLSDVDVILNGYNTNPYVYAVVNRLAMLAASVPFKVQKVVDRKKAKQYEKMAWGEKIDRTGKRLKSESMEDMPDHPLQRLLDRPNNQDGSYEYFLSYWINKFVTGNGIMEAIKPTQTRPPIELWVLPPLGVTINESNNFYNKVIEYYFNWGVTSKTIQPDLVMHSRYYNPNGKIWGLSPISAARRSVKMVNDGEDWNVALIQNGAKPEYVIIVPQGTGPEQREQIKRDWRERYGGKMNVGRDPIVSEGDFMKFEQLGYTVKDMDWSNSNLTSMRKVYDVYGVSSEIFNDPENKTMSNKREALRALYTDKLLPEIESLRSELQRWLVPMFKDDSIWISVDTSGVDALNDEKDKVAERMVKSKWLTDNEKREAMGYERLPDPIFDQVWKTMGDMPVSEIMLSDLNEAEKQLTIKEYGG